MKQKSFQNLQRFDYFLCIGFKFQYVSIFVSFVFRNAQNAKQVHTCPDCGKEYNNKKNLVDHQKIKHQNILPFSCEHCEKRFPSGSMMRTHIKNVHSREKCLQCGVEISNKYWFRRHMLTAHGVKQDGAIQCDFCPKLFFSTSCKDKHIQNNHLNEIIPQLNPQN